MSDGLLDQLEQKVHAAAERIRGLKGENARLSAQISKLEGELELAQDNPAATAWAEEREDIRQRVEKLAATLEGLLEEES